VFETVCASALAAMCAYQIGEHLYLTFTLLMKGEKIFFKENIPAFSVQGKSRSISFCRKIW
jgi:hypothetical protein